MRRRRFASAREKLLKETKTGAYGNIIPLIAQGKVVPVISNSFYIEQIFTEENETAEQSSDPSPYIDEDKTYDEVITKEWADYIKYPMPDKYDIASVAQYHLVEEAKEKVTSYLARAKYLNFMKEFILRVFEDEEEYQDFVSELKLVAREKRFSDIVSDLELPKSPNGAKDPLRLLASFPLPYYITTSYYDFLERALIDVNKEPITQVCFWSGEIKEVKPEHLPNNDIVPTPHTPMVYHLYGLEDYPETLVLSEDDFMNFLIKVMGHTNNQNPIVPLGLQEKLAESQLLLLGFQLNDWDFRVLFRFLLNYRQREKQLLERGMVIQLKEPGEKEMGDVDKTLDYLRDYFNQENFEVKRKEITTFIQELWSEWNPEGQGES